MAAEGLSARERYYNRFISELDGRVQTILDAATLLCKSGVATLPEEETESTAPLVAAVDDIYRQAHSIRGVAGTLGLEPAREAADILAETALHLNEEGMLADGAVWELIVQTASALAMFGVACQQGQSPDATALAAEVPALRMAFSRRFAPPEDAVDDFLEVARVLRLTEEEIAAYRFPTQEQRRHEDMSLAVQGELGSPAVSMRVARDDLEPASPGDAPVLATGEPWPATSGQLGDLEGADRGAALVDETAAPREKGAEPPAEAMLLPAAEAADEVSSAEPEVEVKPPAPAPDVPQVSRMLTIFCQSGSRLLEQVPPALAALEGNRWDQSAMRTARRIFHTIKGDGRQVSLTGIAALAEAAEDIFDAVFEAREAAPEANHGVPAEAMPLLQRAYHTLTTLLADPERVAGGGGEPDQPEIEALLEVAGLVGGPASMGVTEGRAAQEDRRRRLLPGFLTESRHLCDRLHEHISILSADPADLHSLLGGIRALHTLKGNASSMDQEPLVALAAAGESLLEQAATSGEPLLPMHIGLLGDLDGALRHVIDTVDHGEDYDLAALAPLLDALIDGAQQAVAQESVPTPSPDAATTTSGPAPAPVSLTQVRFVPRPAPAAGPGQADEPAHARARADVAPRPIFMPRSSSDPERARAQRRSLTESITSVDLDEVDRTVDLFGRLVTSRTMLARGIDDLERPAGESARNSHRLRTIIDKLAGEFELVRRERRAASQRDGWDPVELETFDSFTQIMLELGEIIADQEEISDTLREGVRRSGLICESDKEATDELQQALLGFRLVRLSTIEPRLEQVISATARAVGKQVTWRLYGGDIKVDKAVLDAVQEPLLHLLRNAVDHGIESAEERTAKGKQPGGAITVEASYGANSVIITVMDDGGGIDPERVAATAVARGVLSAEAAAALDERARSELIWQPGFSTASTVTDISGRGVGLDIVRSAIARVRGSVTMESAIGRGTRFSLSLPLSLSVVRTLLVQDGAATVAAPITQIEGVHLVSMADIATLPDRTVAVIEGRSVTLLPQGLGRAIPLAERLTGEHVTLLEVRQGGAHTAGFLIDEVLGEEDTLVKALPGYLAHRSEFVGCSVAGDGRPYAIVDLRQLAARCGGDRVSTPVITPMLSLPRMASQPVRPLVLVVDDSLFMRRSLAEVYAGAGFAVETAEDGEAALAAIARHGMPALISLDMEMPRMNGLEMLAVLRQLPGGQGVPVFMITTRGQERHRKAALNAGVTRYFIKPFDSDDLLAAARDECRAPLISSIA